MDLNRVSRIVLPPLPPNNTNAGSSSSRHVGKIGTSVLVESSLLRCIPKLKEGLDSFDVEDNKSKLKLEVQDGDAEKICPESGSIKDIKQCTRKRISTSLTKSNAKLPKIEMNSGSLLAVIDKLLTSRSVSKSNTKLPQIETLKKSAGLLAVIDQMRLRTSVSKSNTKLPSINKSGIITIIDGLKNKEKPIKPKEKSTKGLTSIYCECCLTNMFKDVNGIINVFYCSAKCARIKNPELPLSEILQLRKTIKELNEKTELQRLEQQSRREHNVGIYTNDSGVTQIFNENRGLLETAACKFPASAQSGVKSCNNSIFLPD